MADAMAGAEYGSEMFCVIHHVANGGCFDEFMTAMDECHPWALENSGRPAADAEACVKATAALRRCFAGNPEWFRHVYLRRIDEGLDQDTKQTPQEIEQDMIRGMFRWWTGMRRT